MSATYCHLLVFDGRTYSRPICAHISAPSAIKYIFSQPVLTCSGPLVDWLSEKDGKGERHPQRELSVGESELFFRMWLAGLAGWLHCAHSLGARSHRVAVLCCTSPLLAFMLVPTRWQLLSADRAPTAPCMLHPSEHSSRILAFNFKALHAHTGTQHICESVKWPQGAHISSGVCMYVCTHGSCAKGAMSHSITICTHEDVCAKMGHFFFQCERRWSGSGTAYQRFLG